MSDEYVEVSERGLGDNLLDSIKGIAVGGVLFLVSFPVLWWNEGRTDMSEVAKQAKPANPAAVDKALDGKLVSVTGPLKSTEKVGDNLLVRPGDYIALQRVVEQFSWIEQTDSETKKKLGGGSTTTKTYRYERDWTASPQPPEKMKVPDGHRNPRPVVEGGTFYPARASVAIYNFNPKDASLFSFEKLPLRDDLLTDEAKAGAAPETKDGAKDGAKDAAKDGDAADPKTLKGGDDSPAPAADDEKPKKAKKRRKTHGRRTKRMVVVREERPAPVPDKPMPTGYTLSGDTLFRGRGSLDAPQIGDVRVTYKAIQPGAEVTLFGEQSGSDVKPFLNKGEDRLYRVIKGSPQQAVNQMAGEHKAMTWILRLVGFLCMWFGLSMFFGPINAVLDIVPFLGSAGRFLVGLVLLPVSLLLSTVVILLSIIAHSPILLVLTLAAVGGGGYFLYQRRRKRGPLGAAPPGPPAPPAIPGF